MPKLCIIKKSSRKRSCLALALAAMDATAVAALAAVVGHDHARAFQELLQENSQLRRLIEQLRQQLEQQRIQLRHHELQLAETRTTNAWARFHLHTGHAEMALDHLEGHYPDN